MSALRIPVLLLALSLFGCAIVDNADSDPSAASQGYYFDSCSPVDGPAFEIIIPEEAASCQDVFTIDYSQPWAQTFTRIYIYQPFSRDRDTTYSFGEEVDPGPGYFTGGWAGYCEEAGANCVIARSGTLQLFGSSSRAPQADIDIFYEDGSRQTARIQLSECVREQPLLCG